MSDRLFTDCCYGTDWQHGENQECPQEIAKQLSVSQLGLLEDLCRCPRLFAGQYVFDGAGIEHLPQSLWHNRYKSEASAMLGLGNAYPSDLGLCVQGVVELAL